MGYPGSAQHAIRIPVEVHAIPCRRISSTAYSKFMKRHFMLVLLSVLGFAVNAAELPPAEDLAAAVADGARKQQPVVVMFSSENCPFCRAVAPYLEVLAKDPAYHGQAQVRLVETHNANRILIDFDGERRSHASFADQQGVGFVPIVRFFGPHGTRLAPDMVGLGLEDFYLSYLLESVGKARSKLKRIPSG